MAPVHYLLFCDHLMIKEKKMLKNETEVHIRGTFCLLLDYWAQLDDLYFKLSAMKCNTYYSKILTIRIRTNACFH